MSQCGTETWKPNLQKHRNRWKTSTKKSKTTTGSRQRTTRSRAKRGRRPLRLRVEKRVDGRRHARRFGARQPDTRRGRAHRGEELDGRVDVALPHLFVRLERPVAW